MAIETGSSFYNAIKRYYQGPPKLYDNQDMLNFVEWGTLTKEQYAAITGKVYPEPSAETPTEEPTTEEPATEEPTNEGTDGGDTEPPSEGPSGATDGSTGTE